MIDLSKAGQQFLYMKVGTHAKEPLEDIIKRKTLEIEQAGYAMWGYGGNTCHPQTKVQPFARTYEQRGGVIYLCMEEMDSRHFAEQVRAEEWSVDGTEWHDIPPAISVLGSRYALVIKNLHKEEFDISLRDTKVAIGDCAGVPGSKYIKGRVDKGCLEVLAPPSVDPHDDKPVHIKLVAEIIDPYAVLLRNKPQE
jgi:hypothetical protein